ncbi:hypothetical protein CRC_00852 [Cylindrospermopsis raciborskii CS-505]|uniref:hypothetical protein n=1 Tax=Cylindrospermopsis raciborskii TaxID=77022 RepID=UPI0001C171F9|nr:hypothetical protein [Cylindrospermopsis raciborskii]EFA70598.1 hypothetical protein CRC_00852 [Cylindrospermopsis raciborskii CS-505]
MTPKLAEKLQRLPGLTAFPQPIPRYGATLLGKETLALVGGIKYNMNVGWLSFLNPSYK